MKGREDEDMVKYNEMYEMRLNNTGHWIDEIRLCGEGGKAIIRLVFYYRYKMSDRSGDEWRLTSGWQVHESMVPCIQGDCSPWERDVQWWDFDTGYGGDLGTGCAALYPGLFGSQPLMHDIPILCIDFHRKGRLLYRSSHDEQAVRLLVAAGHLPWAWVTAQDQGLGTEEAWDDMRRLCFQDGCGEKATGLYGLLHTYDRCVKGSAWVLPSSPEPQPTRRYVRAFCPLHLRRGDCAFEDADENYEVLAGMGPREAKGWEEYKSQSSVVYLSAGRGEGDHEQ